MGGSKNQDAKNAVGGLLLVSFVPFCDFENQIRVEKGVFIFQRYQIMLEV